jgi:hypothetical protein
MADDHIPAPARVSLSKAQGQELSAPPVEQIPEVPVTNAGLELAKRFGLILAGYLFIAAVTVTSAQQRWLSELATLSAQLTAASASGSAAFDKEKVESLLLPLSAAYEKSQSGAVAFHQTVIVNVLLPVLTALLGYLFASRTKSGTTGSQ